MEQQSQHNESAADAGLEPQVRDWNRILHVVFALIGAGVLLYLIASIGPARIWSQVTHLTYMFALGVGAFLLSKIFMALSWRHLFYPGRSRASWWDLSVATIVGGAINDVTPGGVGGEPLKVTWLSHKVPGEDLVSSLLLHNYLYVLTNILLMLAGGVALMVLVDLPGYAVAILVVVMALMVAGGLVLALILRKGVAHRFMRLLGRLKIRFRNADALLEKARTADEQARQFFAERPLAMVKAFGWMLVSRATAAMETYFFLSMLGWIVFPGDVLLITCLTVAVYIVFPFVPSQIGAMEGSAYLLYPILGFGASAGVAVEMVRRLRVLVMLSIALAFMGVRALALRVPVERPDWSVNS